MNTSESYWIYAIGMPAVFFMIAVEAIITTWKGRNVYKWDDSVGSTLMFAGNVIIQALVGGLVFLAYLWMYDRRLVDLNELMPGWLLWILLFLSIDLVFYWFHRLSHRTAILWSIHMSHHCSIEMNFLVALRQPWLAPIAKTPFFAVLPLLGFDPAMIVIAAPIATLWGVIGHTKTVPRLPEVIEFIFNTPSAHRVHHGSNPKYIDKNFGNVFMIWDRLFGTYQREEEEVVFGLDVNVKTQNPVILTFQPLSDLIRKMSEEQSIGRRVRVLLGPP